MADQQTSLYLVPTPIGNLEDITLRGLRILKEVDTILAEDTRTSGKLLKHFDIQTKVISHHAHNEHKTTEGLIERMKNGETYALISDAGSPGISDPGFFLGKAVMEAGLKIEALPGATAFVPALLKSGLPCDRFCFEGFLPQKKGRQTKLLNLVEEQRTMVFYESPHRIGKLLEQFKEHYGGDRQVSVSRELTKMFEETFNGTVEEAIAHFGGKKVKGEIVVVLAGKND